jgi:hypothetical protein
VDLIAHRHAEVSIALRLKELINEIVAVSYEAKCAGNIGELALLHQSLHSLEAAYESTEGAWQATF